VIQVRKADLAPRVLREDGARLTEELCRKVDAGEPPIIGHNAHETYGAEEVKRALSAAQHDKCCFRGATRGCLR